MANIVQMMQKASQMKQKMQELQARVKQTEVTGEAGGGLVRCCLNGRFELKTLKIAPSLINPQEAEVLEDMVIAAVNDARRKVEKLMGDETQKIMTEMGLPAGLELPF
ncbi:MAG: YbaB/EbfC family nucleoid-associated protein [Alphaproteobacteria bacterium]|nr:YbaB/EbfC family nucleoid-associated protein [Alphaproteobacteria bacterium]